MLEFLSDHLVALLIVAVVCIYVMAYRILAPRKEQLRDCVKFGPETDISGYAESAGPCFWRDSHDGTPTNYGGMAFNGTSAADFSIPTRTTFNDRVPNLMDGTATLNDIESVDTAISYAELMGRLQSGKDVLPETMPVTFEMLLSLVMSMIDTNERKGDARTCDKVFDLLHRKYAVNSLNSVPEARYLELWVDLKQLEPGRG